MFLSCLIQSRLHRHHAAIDCSYQLKLMTDKHICVSEKILPEEREVLLSGSLNNFQKLNRIELSRSKEEAGESKSRTVPNPETMQTGTSHETVHLQGQFLSDNMKKLLVRMIPSFCGNSHHQMSKSYIQNFHKCSNLDTIITMTLMSNG